MAKAKDENGKHFKRELTPEQHKIIQRSLKFGRIFRDNHPEILDAYGSGRSYPAIARELDLSVLYGIQGFVATGGVGNALWGNPVSGSCEEYTGLVERNDRCVNYRLREAREAKSLDVKELAGRVGISLGALHGYELLKSMPPRSVQRNIARKLQRKISDLFPDGLAEMVEEIMEERTGGRPLRELQSDIVYWKNRADSLNLGISVRKYSHPEGLDYNWQNWQFDRASLKLERLKNLEFSIPLDSVPEEDLASIKGVGSETNLLLLSNKIDQVLRSMGSRLRKIIELRYGLCGVGTFTLDEIAPMIGVSRERVRQLEAKAIKMLQLPNRAREFEGFAIDPTVPCKV